MNEIQRKMMSSDYIPTDEEIDNAYRKAIRDSIKEVIEESMREIIAKSIGGSKGE